MEIRVLPITFVNVIHLFTPFIFVLVKSLLNVNLWRKQEGNKQKKKGKFHLLSYFFSFFVCSHFLEELGVLNVRKN